MKRTILTALLAAACAAAASAQVAPIRLIAPVNPVAGLPKLLPSPISGPLAGVGISLPTPAPSQTPSLTLAPAAGIVPLIIPIDEGSLRALQSESGRDGIVAPSRREKGIAIQITRLSAAQAAAETSSGNRDSAKDELDQTFDGSDQPTSQRRAPVSSGRHITLPERDLEQELGL